MKNLRSYISVGVLVFASQVAMGQDVHFSQFYETTILRNPALTGIFSGDYKVTASYRNQWSSISQPFVTGQVSAEAKIPVNERVNDFFSVGLLTYFDRAGSIDMKSLGIYPVVAFSKSLEDVHNSYISAGFTGGYIQKSFDPTKVRTNSQYVNGGYNPDQASGENLNNPKLSHFDLGAGVTFSSGGGENNEVSYFVGVAGYHFTRPSASFLDNEEVKMDMKWSLNGGLTYRINDDFGVIAQANYTKQGGYTEIIGGGLLNWKRASERQSDPLFVIYAGGFYRWEDAFIPVVKVDYMRYSFGFSYDVNVSGLKAATNLRGGYELTLVKTGLFQDDRWQKSRTTCPHFFW